MDEGPIAAPPGAAAKGAEGRRPLLCSRRAAKWL